VEDEVAIQDLLLLTLNTAEFTLIAVSDAHHAMDCLADNIPDLILVDWMLPGKSGIDFITGLKQQELYKDIPIIMLTAKAEADNKIKGLMAGADDYITKPFSLDEMIARIKTVLRRGPVVSPNNEVAFGKLVLNTAKHQVFIAGERLSLTPLQYKILFFFMTHPEKIYTRDQLLSLIWGNNSYLDERSIDNQIRRLRAKLKPANHQHLIKTIRGVGYCFSKQAHDQK